MSGITNVRPCEVASWKNLVEKSGVRPAICAIAFDLAFSN